MIYFERQIRVNLLLLHLLCFTLAQHITHLSDQAIHLLHAPIGALESMSHLLNFTFETFLTLIYCVD
jgi:hypothetical protein